MKATILGCGSSGGIPRLGGPDGRGNWGDCDPANPKNRRRRCSLLVEVGAGTTGAGEVGPGKSGPGDSLTRILIDTGPDLVPQLLDAGVGWLDAVVYTHAHADHTHGIDDLRQLVFNTRKIMPIWADAATAASLLARFGYIFETPPGSFYPPIGALNDICGPFTVEGAGGAIRLVPLRVQHGEITALGFRIETDGKSLVYLPDVSAIPEKVWPAITGADVFICDALRRKPHPSHAHLDLAVDWIGRSGAARGIITNMHLDMDYAEVDRDTPEHIEPAFDGMVITL